MKLVWVCFQPLHVSLSSLQIRTKLVPSYFWLSMLLLALTFSYSTANILSKASKTRTSDWLPVFFLQSTSYPRIAKFDGNIWVNWNQTVSADRDPQNGRDPNQHPFHWGPHFVFSLSVSHFVGLYMITYIYPLSFPIHHHFCGYNEH